MKQKLYAFWRYDHFPYVLGGEITQILPDGSVETFGYGKGFYFQPFKIVPVAEGRKIQAKLDELRVNEREAFKEHHEEWENKVKAVIDFPA